MVMIDAAEWLLPHPLPDNPELAEALVTRAAARLQFDHADPEFADAAAERLAAAEQQVRAATMRMKALAAKEVSR